MIVTCVKMKLIINAKTMDINKSVLAIIEKLEALNYTVVIVGGFVRDSLLEKTSSDYDLATNAPLSVLEALFTIENEYYVDVQGTKVHTVSKVSYEGVSVEVTQFRKETYDENFKLKDIEFVDTFFEDVKRRDFTINALAYHKELIDEVDGLADLNHHLIKTIGDPNIRFQEDPSRMIRALRFMAELNFTLEKETHDALLKHRSLILQSKNINDDLKLLLQAPYFSEVYQSYQDVFSILSNGKFTDVSLDNRSILSDDRTLLAYLVFSLKLNYDNTIFRHLKFQMRDKKFILSIKPLVRELMIPLSQNDIVLLYLAYGQNTMLRVYDMMKDLDIVNPLNLLNVKKVFVEGYLKIDQLAVTVNDLNDSYTIKQKYRILKDIQKLIIRNELTNNRKELLEFIQNYY